MPRQMSFTPKKETFGQSSKIELNVEDIHKQQQSILSDTHQYGSEICIIAADNNGETKIAVENVDSRKIVDISTKLQDLVGLDNPEFNQAMRTSASRRQPGEDTRFFK